MGCSGNKALLPAVTLCYFSLLPTYSFKLYISRMTNAETEARLQGAMYVYFHNTYPELRGLLCYNLNNSKNAIDGSRNRSLGLQKGRSDLVLYLQGRAYMIEVKTPAGSQSKFQKEWQQQILSHGFEYIVVRTLSEFQQLITKIVKTNGI